MTKNVRFELYRKMIEKNQENAYAIRDRVERIDESGMSIS